MTLEEIRQRYGVMAEASKNVAAGLEKPDDPRVVELLQMVAELLLRLERSQAETDRRYEDYLAECERVRVAQGQADVLALKMACIWQTDRPTQGLWWVSLHPDQREGAKKAVYEVSVTAIGHVIASTGAVHPLDEPIFTGAKWARREVPGDPFAGGGG